MALAELLNPGKILLIESPPADKLDLLRDMLSTCLAGTEPASHEEAIRETLIARENSMSTGIGEGVAIPHCSTEYVDEMHATLALLGKDLDFKALDERPVRIVVLLLMPRSKFEKHIRTLATIAKLFKDGGFREQVLAVESPERAHDLIMARLKELD